MNELNIIATNSTPMIRTDGASGTLQLAGDSYPEHAFEFFAPLMAWVKQHLAQGDAPLRLELALLYLNTSSVRILMDILDQAEEAFQAGRDVSLTWRYDSDNERVAELAEEFREDCTFPFTIEACETR